MVNSAMMVHRRQWRERDDVRKMVSEQGKEDNNINNNNINNNNE